VSATLAFQNPLLDPTIQDGRDPPSWKWRWRHFSAPHGLTWMKFHTLVQN